MSIFKYKPEGVCSQEFIFKMDGSRIVEAEFVRGCPGNLLGIASLIKGNEAQDVIDRLQGIKCGKRNTSCPDQISIALQEYLKSI